MTKSLSHPLEMELSGHRKVEQSQCDSSGNWQAHINGMLSGLGGGYHKEPAVETGDAEEQESLLS